MLRLLPPLPPTWQSTFLIWAKCGPLNQHQRAAIGLTVRDKKNRLLTLPRYDALKDNQPTFYTRAFAWQGYS
jgi:hypothetical protein